MIALTSLFVSALTGSSRAADRDYLLRWIPASGGSPASGFRVFLVPRGTMNVRAIDLGPVDPDGDGIARATLVIDGAVDYVAAMDAYNEVGESGISNVIRIVALACGNCDDGDPCTLDGCSGGQCSHGPVPDGTLCPGSNVCRSGVCMAPQCLAASDCDDGDPCNGAEQCSGLGTCLAGSALDCGQPTPCSAPRCDARAGCQTDLLPDGTACDDGRPETTLDVCRAGVCIGACPGTRDYALRWIPGGGSPADGYRVYLASGSESFGAGMDLGFVAAGGDGVARATLSLDAATDYRAAMSGYDAAGESSLSNVIAIVALPCGAPLASVP